MYVSLLASNGELKSILEGINASSPQTPSSGKSASSSGISEQTTQSINLMAFLKVFSEKINPTDDSRAKEYDVTIHGKDGRLADLNVVICGASCMQYTLLNPLNSKHLLASLKTEAEKYAAMPSDAQKEYVDTRLGEGAWDKISGIAEKITIELGKLISDGKNAASQWFIDPMRYQQNEQLLAEGNETVGKENQKAANRGGNA